MRLFLTALLILSSNPTQAISRRQALGTFISAACYVATDQYKRKCNLKPIETPNSKLPSFANDALVEIHTSIGSLKGRKICDGQLVGNRKTIITAAHCSNLVQHGSVKVYAKRWSSVGKTWAINPSLVKSLEVVDCALEKDLPVNLRASLQNLQNTVGFMSHQDLAVLQLDIAAPDWVNPIPLSITPSKIANPNLLHYSRYKKDTRDFWSTAFIDKEEVSLTQDRWPILALHSQSPMCTSMSGGGLFQTQGNKTELIGLASALVGPHILTQNSKKKNLSCTIPDNAASKNYFFLIARHYEWLKQATKFAGQSRLNQPIILEPKPTKKTWVRVTSDKNAKASISCSDHDIRILFHPNAQDSMGELSSSFGHDFWIKRRNKEATYFIGIRNQIDKSWQEAGIYFPEQSYDSFVYDQESQKAIFLDMTNQLKKVHILKCSSMTPRTVY